MFTVLLLNIATFFLAAMLVMRHQRQSRTSEPPPPADIAPHEWERVRRTWQSATRRARGNAMLGAVGAALFAAWGVQWEPVGYLISAAFLYAVINHGALWPDIFHDAIATATEIRITSLIRKNADFPRDRTYATLVLNRKTTVPFTLTLHRDDGRRRELDLDHHGVSILRAMGWLAATEELEAAPASPADQAIRQAAT